MQRLNNPESPTNRGSWKVWRRITALCILTLRRKVTLIRRKRHKINRGFLLSAPKFSVSVRESKIVASIWRRLQRNRMIWMGKSALLLIERGSLLFSGGRCCMKNRYLGLISSFVKLWIRWERASSLSKFRILMKIVSETRAWMKRKKSTWNWMLRIRCWRSIFNR